MTYKEIDNCSNIDSVNLLCLMINEMIGHFEEKHGNKYLVLDDIDETNEFQRNIKKFGMELKKKLKRLMLVKKLNMGKIL